MGIFSGFLEKSSSEFSFIAIDNFMENVYSATAFFLSHFHSDHYPGLRGYEDVKQFCQELSTCPEKKIYCTKMTKMFMRNDYNCRHIPESYIIAVDVGSPLELTGQIINKNGEKKDVFVTVELIPTGHIPGAVMFLFEHRDKRVLYTGDFRINPIDLPKFKQLHDGDGFVKSISELYIDMTFASADYPSFPSREDCAVDVSRLAKEWLDQSPKNEVGLRFNYIIAYEFLIIEVSKALKCKIRIDMNVYESYFASIPELDNCLYPQTEPYYRCKYRVHVCVHPSYRCKICDKFKPENVKTINPVAMPFNRKLIKNIIKAKLGKGLILENCKLGKSDNSIIVTKVCYSTHSSLEEFTGFIKYYNAKNIYPLCKPNEEQKKVLKLCRNKNFNTLDNFCSLAYTSRKRHLSDSGEDDI